MPLLLAAVVLALAAKGVECNSPGGRRLRHETRDGSPSERNNNNNGVASSIGNGGNNDTSPFDYDYEQTPP